MLALLQLALLLLGSLGATRAWGGPQTLVWGEPSAGGVLRIGQGYPLRASASSGLEVRFRVLRGPARIEGGTLTATGVGSIEVLAEQAGDAVTDPVVELRRFNRSSFEYRSVELGLSGLPIADVTIEGDLAIAACNAAGVVIFDISDRDHPVEVSRIDTPGLAVAVRAEQGLLVVADYLTIEAYDIREPARPRWLSRFIPPVLFVDRLALSGGIALIGGSGYPDFEFVDYSDPETPVGSGAKRLLVSHVSRVEGSAGNFAISSGFDTLYFGVTGRFQISTNGASSADRPIQGFSFAGDLAAVASFDGSIRLKRLNLTEYPVDVSSVPLEPQLPLPLRELECVGLSPRWLLGFEQQSRTVFGFRMDDPTKPEPVGQVLGLSTWDQVRSARFHADGETLVVTLGNSAHLLRLREGVAQRLEFEPPSSVRPTQSVLPLTAQAESGGKVEFEVLSGPAKIDGDRLVISGPGSIEVRANQSGESQFLSASVVRQIVVADPPRILRQPEPRQAGTGDRVVLSVAVSEDPPSGYQWYRNGQVVPRATAPSLAFPMDAGRSGLYAVVASNVAGVVTSRWVSVGSGAGLAIQPRGVLRNMGAGEPGDGPEAMASRGRHLWTASGVGGALRVFDLQNLDEPAEIGGLGGTPGVRPSAMVLVDDIALIAEGPAGLGVVDISKPAAPERVATVPLSGTAWDLVLEGRRLYVAGGSAGVQVLDVSEPRRPKVISQWVHPVDVRGLAVGGNRLAILEAGGAVALAEFQNVGGPALLARFPAVAGSSGQSLKYGGGVVLVSDLTLGIRALEHSEPSLIRETRRVAGRSWRSQWVGGRLYSADEVNGFQVLNLEQPTRPALVGMVSESESGKGLRVDGNRLAVLGRDLRVFEIEPTGMAPILTSGLESRRVQVGQSVRLDAPVAGTGPFQYRWLHDGAVVPGAVGPSLEWASISTRDSGDYSVEVSGKAGSLTAVIVRLDVTAEARIQQGSATIGEDGGVRFRVEAAVGTRIVVKRSNDLRDWSDWKLLEMGSDAMEVRDPDLGGERRFYRLEVR
jgi:hypothetical protein